MISNIFLQKFLSQSSIGKKFILAFIFLLLAFILLLAWILYDFNGKLKDAFLQQHSAEYHAQARKIYEGIKLQKLDEGSEPATEEYIESTFNQLIALDKKYKDELGTNPEELSQRRPGVGTPESLFSQWTQSTITTDKATKLQLYESIEQQLAMLMRYVTNNAPPGTYNGLYYYRFQQLLDPTTAPAQNAKYWKELIEDVQNSGLPKIILANLPQDTNPSNKEGIAEESFFREEMSRQHRELIDLGTAELLSYRRKLLAILIFCSCTFAAMGIYFLWYIYRPLIHMLETNRKFTEGDSSVRYRIESSDEIGLLGGVFNNLYSLISDMVKHIDSAGKMLKTSSDDILKTAEVQQDTVVEQEKITRQIGNKAYDISETSKELSETMTEISQASESASSLAQEGRIQLQHLENIMQKLVGASNHLVSTLSHLNDRTRGVTSIISTMVHVADETNMLSLNTALEAAKAKQVGKGFAIIASEIKRLAEQTALATLNIERVIKEILEMMDHSLDQVQLISDEILNSVDKASQVQLHFTEIFDKVQYVSGKFNAVDAAMRNQLQSARDIDGSIQLLKLVSQDSMRTIKQFRTSLLDLNSTVSILKQAKGDF
ncbi:MAG: methyl-accepting chemotaxis protein [Parachlamydiales bacterium]|jgi:methyl-accepting chemotaxis protein